MGRFQVSKSRPGARPPEHQSELSATAGARPIAAWVRFWFTPADPVGLCLLRILAGLLFLALLLPLAGHVEDLFGLNVWFDRRAYSEAGRLPGGIPHALSWSVLYLCGANHALLMTTYWLSLGVIVLFTAGLWT